MAGRSQIDSSILRIFNANGIAVGVGFLVDDQHAITCAHVIKSALGLRTYRDTVPDTEITVDFPRIAPGRKLVTRVFDWSTSKQNDLAILELVEPAPKNATPARLVQADELWHHNFRAFGFPKGHENGTWATGRILGAKAGGWFQIESVELTGIFIQPGFSGSPVWDEELNGVVGMIMEAEIATRVAFMSPVNLFASLYPEIAENIEFIKEIKSELFWVSPPKGRTDFYAHVPLPPQYVERLELLAEVRQTLLNAPGNVAFTSGLQAKGLGQAQALHGMGGIGKTIMARALCDDLEVQDRFPDGILWATLGENPNIAIALKQWVEALGGHMTIPAPTEAQYKEALLQLLAERHCLLIVDDVWQDEHLHYFQVGGQNCQLLLTTRNKGIAERIRAHAYPIPTMSKDEAIALLDKWANQNLKQVSIEKKLAVIERLTNLPLAIKLTGAHLREIPIETWLYEFQKLRDLDLEWGTDDPEKSLYASFALSLRPLKFEVQKLYFSLGIFREDESIPNIAIRNLWLALEPQMSALQVNTLLSEMANRALIEIRAHKSQFLIQLHDLLRQFIQENLGSEIPAIHRILLDVYKNTKTKSGWDTAPDDGYLYDHLVYHLEAIGDYEQIKALFSNDSWLNKRVEAEGHIYNGYIRDLTRAWNYAYQRTMQSIESNHVPVNIPDCVHYVLIRATINSIVDNYVPELVVRAIEVGLWSKNRVLSLIERIPDSRKQFVWIEAVIRNCNLDPIEMNYWINRGLNTIELLSVHLQLDAFAKLILLLKGQEKDDLIERALRVMKKTLQDQSLFIDKKLIAYALINLSLQVDGKRKTQFLDGALAEAMMLPEIGGRYGDESPRARVLTAIIRHLEGEQKDQILGLAIALVLKLPQRDYHGEWSPQVDGLLEIIPNLIEIHENGFIEKLFKMAIALPVWNKGESRSPIAEALVKLAPYLEGELLEKAMVAARELPIKSRESLSSPRAEALIGLAPRLQGEMRSQSIDEALTAALVLQKAGAHIEGNNCAILFSRLIPFLEGAQKKQVLRLAVTTALLLPLGDYWNENSPRVDALLELSLLLEEPEKTEVLSEALKAAMMLPRGSRYNHILFTKRNYTRGEALAKLAPHLGKSLLESALAPVVSLPKIQIEFNNSNQKIKVHTEFGEQLTWKQKNKILQKALRATIALPVQDRFGEHSPRAEALIVLAPDLEGKLLEEALNLALALPEQTLSRNSSPRAKALAVLSQQFSNDRKNQLFKIAIDAALTLPESDTFKETSPRAEVLVDLACQFEGNLRTQILEKAFDASMSLPTNAYRNSPRGVALGKLAPLLEGILLQKALVAADQLPERHNTEEVSSRAEVLAKLALQLGERQRIQVLEQALSSLSTLEKPTVRAKTLSNIIQYLNQESDVKVFRKYVANELLNLYSGWQEDIIDFLKYSEVFNPKTLNLPDDAFSTIKNSIIDISKRWKWV